MGPCSSWLCRVQDTTFSRRAHHVSGENSVMSRISISTLTIFVTGCFCTVILKLLALQWQSKRERCDKLSVTVPFPLYCLPCQMQCSSVKKNLPYLFGIKCCDCVDSLKLFAVSISCFASLTVFYIQQTG